MEQIEQEVLKVLSTVEIEGTNVKITEHLDRKLYLAVNEVLDRIGGKWNRKAKAHVFSEDPTAKMNAVIECGVLEPKVKTGYFPTPPALVSRMIELAELEDNHTILEPSAGQGHISDAVCSDVSIFPNNINVCEVLPDNIKVLESKGYYNRGDFFEYASLCSLKNITFDRILMNPPFEVQSDLSHISTAFNLLREGGVLVAIMSAGVLFRDNKKTRAFRTYILDNHAEVVERNPEGAFKSSGTMVNTIMVKLVK